MSASGELYSLHHASGRWNILQALPSNEVSPSAFNCSGKENNLLCLVMSFLALLATMFPQECAKNQHLCIRAFVKKCQKNDCLK